MATSPVDEPAAAAFLALLGTNVNLTVLDGEVPTGVRPPYTLVYFAGGEDLGDDFRGRSTEATVRAYVHSVAETASGARIVAGQASATLLGQVLAVPGWSCGPIRRETKLPPAPDKTSTGELVMDKVDVYVWRMTAA